MVEDEVVAAAQAVDGERKAAKLVFVIRIGAGDVEDEVRVKVVEGADQMRVEDGEIVFVAEAVGKVGVEIRGRLGFGIVMLLVD